jgi:hypothetical protein
VAAIMVSACTGTADGGHADQGAPGAPVATPADPGGTSASDGGIDDDRYASYLRDIDVGNRTLTFDVVRFLVGDEARAAYHKAYPDDPDDPPNDYFIVPTDERHVTLSVAPDVVVRLVRLHEGTGAGLTPGTWDELPRYLAAYAPGDGRLSWNPFWLSVVDGQIIEIEEQYVP